MACGAPNIVLGTAQRYAGWIDCQAATIGRDGFLGLAGYTVDSGLLTATLTIFIALIGYRLLLGGRVDLGDATGWAAKLGIALTMLTGWIAFRTVFYDLALGAPAEIAGRIAGASGIAFDESAVRLQRAYDSLRLGLDVPVAGVADASEYQTQPALPVTAVMFLLVTIGFGGAAKLAAAFLLAIAPLPALALLFGPAMGIFAGWLRALLTTVFAAAGLALTGALTLVGVEAEIARMQGLGIASRKLIDEQAPMALVLLFILASLAIVWLSAKIAAGLAERLWQVPAAQGASSRWITSREAARQSVAAGAPAGASSVGTAASSVSRSARIVEAFDRSARRSEGFGGGGIGPIRHVATTQPSGQSQAGGPQATCSSTRQGARRALGRRHRSALRRDRIG